jgi:hypothetical protein
MVKKIILLSTALLFTLSTVEAKKIIGSQPPPSIEENNGKPQLTIRLSTPSPSEEEIQTNEPPSSNIPVPSEEELKKDFILYLLETVQPNEEVSNAFKKIILEEVEKIQVPSSSVTSVPNEDVKSPTQSSTPSSPPTVTEENSFFATVIRGGKTSEEFKKNIETEQQRGIESLHNFVNGKGWKSNTSLEKEKTMTSTEKQRKQERRQKRAEKWIGFGVDLLNSITKSNTNENK